MSREFKYTKENVELRRGRVLELTAQGFNQSEVSKMLNVSESLISIDMQYIRAQAKENIRLYIDERLPEEYNKCMIGLNEILKESWKISHNTEDNTDKIRALLLAKECYNAKLELLTNVDVVEDVIKFINKERATQSDSSVESSSSEPLTQQQEPSPVSEEEPIPEQEDDS